ncbi:MAG: hypothetical protein IJP44_09975 [Bacteroidales bacterium]|nr:hypothetical protein [Bacteroidales bacterium]
MYENIKLTTNANIAQKAYKKASKETREMMEFLFGEEHFNPYNIQDKPANFGEACRKQGIDPYKWNEDHKGLPTNVQAYMRLCIIAEALNDGWKPTLYEGETRYYPVFTLKEVTRYIPQTAKVKNRFKGNDAIPKRDAEFCTVLPSFAFNPTYCDIHLAFRSRELAEYCGVTFWREWSEYLTY